jgi:hypothetical protein
MVGFMKPGKLRRKKRASLLLLWITVLLAATNTSSRARLRLGGRRILTITVCNKVGVDVPRSTRGGQDQEDQEAGSKRSSLGTTSSDVPEIKHQAKLRTVK